MTFRERYNRREERPVPVFGYMKRESIAKDYTTDRTIHRKLRHAARMRRKNRRGWA